jgi:hypothetical protein
MMRAILHDTERGWSRKFEESIPQPLGDLPITFEDASTYITKQWPRNSPENNSETVFRFGEKIPDIDPTIWLSHQIKGTAMTAIAKGLSNAIPAISTDVDSLRTIALFCGVGLLASLVLVASDCPSYRPNLKR